MWARRSRACRSMSARSRLRAARVVPDGAISPSSCCAGSSCTNRLDVIPCARSPQQARRTRRGRPPTLDDATMAASPWCTRSGSRRTCTSAGRSRDRASCAPDRVAVLVRFSHRAQAECEKTAGDTLQPDPFARRRSLIRCPFASTRTRRVPIPSGRRPSRSNRRAAAARFALSPIRPVSARSASAWSSSSRHSAARPRSSRGSDAQFVRRCASRRTGRPTTSRRVHAGLPASVAGVNNRTRSVRGGPGGAHGTPPPTPARSQTGEPATPSTGDRGVVRLVDRRPARHRTPLHLGDTAGCRPTASA